MPTASEVLEIVEIIYFAPALPVSLYVCFRHGFSRETGWIFLSLLCAIRVAGAATAIAANRNSTTGLVTAAFVLASIGSTFLVAALSAIVNRIETGSQQSHLPARVRRYLQIIGLLAIILGSYGGSEVASSDSETQSSGYTYVKVAILLILVQYLASIFILSCSARHIRAVKDSDRKLFFAACAASPLVLIRIIYSTCVAFEPTSTTFSLRSTTVTAVAVRAILAVAMEIVAATVLLLGGMLAPKMIRAQQPLEDDPKEEYKVSKSNSRSSEAR